MALFSECMQLCAQIVLDIADIVRDGDVSPSIVGINLHSREVLGRLCFFVASPAILV